jgi:hypothetical protein
MAFPNLGDIVATTIENRSKMLADNVTKNNALLAWLKKTGNVKTVSGGSQIFQEFLFAENGNFAWYSGYDFLQIAAQDVISGASFPFKQAACPVIISGLEELQNSGPQEQIDLMDGRITGAEATMLNNVCGGIYSDGTGAGGKQITGLAAAVPVTPTTGTYGGIDRAVWTFWRPYVLNDAGVHPTSATVQGKFNQMWANLVRGQDRPRLILVDSQMWQVYVASLQNLVRFVDTEKASLGFPSVGFMDAEVVLDGGIGGFAPPWTAYFLNPKYLFYRPHEKRNMKPLSPSKRVPLNQDAEVQIIAWAGNMTCNGAQFQGQYYAGP